MNDEKKYIDRWPAAPTEKRNTFFKPCNLNGGDLFPMDESPVFWRGCNDACEYTWLSPRNDKYFHNVSSEDRLRLARSSGFCPHLRCQLGNVGHADAKGICPPGMCYHKLLDGAQTFGACCYSDGVFISPGLIGFYDLQRTKQKPIYRRNRVILGNTQQNAEIWEDSYEAFINANEVFPGIIVMQCPLINLKYDCSKSGEVETLSTWKRMITEQGVDLVIQLHPFVGEETCDGPYSTCAREPCINWAKDIFTNVSHPLSADVNWINEMASADGGLVQYEYKINDQHLKHIWLNNWKDFEVPEGENAITISNLALEVASVVRRGGKVAVICYSGRGRSGTLVSASIGFLRKEAQEVFRTSDLVKIIVNMRESRDGLVETPEQFHFVRSILGLHHEIQGLNETNCHKTSLESVNMKYEYGWQLTEKTALLIATIFGGIIGAIITYLFRTNKKRPSQRFTLLSNSKSE